MKGEDEDTDNFWRGPVKDQIEDHRFPGIQRGRREGGTEGERAVEGAVINKGRGIVLSRTRSRV
jgi:hypothetical protein